MYLTHNIVLHGADRYIYNHYSSDSSDVDDLDESTHMALTAMRTPYQNLCIPAQTGMIYSHRAKLGRYVCLP